MHPRLKSGVMKERSFVLVYWGLKSPEINRVMVACISPDFSPGRILFCLDNIYRTLKASNMNRIMR